MEVRLIPLGTPGDAIGKPRDAREAAQQFEALMLAQMLRSAHVAEDSQDPTAETMWDLAAQQFAQVLSQRGGIGLGRLIAARLEPAAAGGLQSKD